LILTCYWLLPDMGHFGMAIKPSGQKDARLSWT
jgi:hypothetical protein